MKMAKPVGPQGPGSSKGSKVVRLVPRYQVPTGAAFEPAPASQVQSRTPPPALDDAAILAGVRVGDRMAATALHHRVRPQVERTILRLLGRRDRDHDDLAQSSLIEVVRSLGRFRGECSLDTWTARVTAHTVFKELRRRRVELGVFDRSAEPEDATGVDLERCLGARAMVERVRRHLDALEPEKAFTLVLHDVCGHDLREVADITEVSVAAAQSRLVRARHELHERCARDPEFADFLRRCGWSAGARGDGRGDDDEHGDEGPRGDEGRRGDEGPRGDKGRRGDKGPRGDKGVRS